MAPKTKEQYQEIRERTTAMIKEAALELFGRKGYHSTSISQIAKEAGISKGLIYNYFESKEALLHDIILEAVEEGEELMNQVFAMTEDGYEILRLIVESSFEWISSRLHYWKLLTSLAFQTDVLTSLEPVLQKKQAVAIEQMAEVFRRMEAERPTEEALFFGALLDGVMLHYMQMEDKYPLDGMKAMIPEKYGPKG
jgi:AcrR family transcriptional regulator